MIPLDRRAMLLAVKRVLFCFAIEALRETRNGQKEESQYLANMLDEMLRSPDKAAEILGIKRRRGRPSESAKSPVASNPHVRFFETDTLRSLGLEETIAKYLSRSFRMACRDPTRAGEAFGIGRTRGRGVTHSQAKHRMLALDVYALRSFNLAMTPSKKDQGIFERVAKRHHCSVDTVERAWKEWRPLLELQDAYKAHLALESPVPKEE
jgi:hypothetical protein